MFMGRIDDMFIDFIGDDEGIKFLGEVGDELEFFAGEDTASGVSGIAEDDRFGPLGESVTKFIGVEEEVRGAEVDINRFSARKDGISGIVFVEGGEDNNFVTRVTSGHHGDHHRFGATTSDDNMFIGVDIDMHETALFTSQSLAELGCAPSHGVLVAILVDGIVSGDEQFSGRVKIGESLGEVDSLILIGNTGHFTNDRFGKMVKSLASCGHDKSS